jgi:NAD(P)-dependent dehydrogenase (short-subunit alcohol dehydrogenase family)
MTRDLASQCSARKGIRVNALCPGYFLTEMTETGASELEANVVANSMLARFGNQEELDPAVIYLHHAGRRRWDGRTVSYRWDYLGVR